MEFLLLGLVGVSILAAVGADSSDEEGTTGETSQEDIEPIPSDPVVTGRDLSFDGSTVLEGTAGDDTIAAGQDSDLAPQEIRLQGGDDIAIIEDQIGGGVYGGAGDDTLTSTEYGNALHGGAGDDILSGVGGNVMSGGVGNDQISLDMNAQPGPDAFRINGGEGDDAIKVQADVGMDTPDRSGANFIGGEGEDAYEFDLTLKNSDVDLNSSGGPLSTSRWGDHSRILTRPRTACWSNSITIRPPKGAMSTGIIAWSRWRRTNTFDPHAAIPCGRGQPRRCRGRGNAECLSLSG